MRQKNCPEKKNLAAAIKKNEYFVTINGKMILRRKDEKKGNSPSTRVV